LSIRAVFLRECRRQHLRIEPAHSSSKSIAQNFIADHRTTRDVRALK
jgi:hypothetical protein